MSDTTPTLISRELLADAAQAAGMVPDDHLSAPRDGINFDFESAGQLATYFLRLGELAALRGASVDRFEDMLDTITTSGWDFGAVLRVSGYVLDDAFGPGLPGRNTDGETWDEENVRVRASQGPSEADWTRGEQA